MKRVKVKLKDGINDSYMVRQKCAYSYKETGRKYEIKLTTMQEHTRVEHTYSPNEYMRSVLFHKRFSPYHRRSIYIEEELAVATHTALEATWYTTLSGKLFLCFHWVSPNQKSSNKHATS
jgi:hypothetical protein